MLCAAGVTAGWLLGEIAVDGQLHLAPDTSTASFADFSANPDALAPQGDGAAPCTDCAPGYAAAARMRAARAERMDNALRELGEVDPDIMQPPAEPADDYSFGGRFRDNGERDLRQPEVPANDTEPGPTNPDTQL